jgi:DNA (cytosine-5)-methyltransferase 1
MNYYNEHDPFAVAWLRELIKAGQIAPGEVDERNIEDVLPNELRKFTQCHFFAGIGVWSYALRQAGWPDDRPVWTGSCPCQPFSAAGKRGGTADERHLWPAFYHLICECSPRIIFGEQVASKDGLAWFSTVSADLEAKAYAVGGVDLCSAGFGAPHIRQRLYFVADSERSQLRTSRSGSLGTASSEVQGANGQRKRLRNDIGEYGAFGDGLVNGFWREAEWIPCRDGKYRPIEPGSSPLATGITNRVGKLRGYGNALTVPVAQGFIEAYLEAEGEIA